VTLLDFFQTYDRILDRHIAPPTEHTNDGTRRT
jgi:hypothetical protein